MKPLPLLLVLAPALALVGCTGAPVAPASTVGDGATIPAEAPVRSIAEAPPGAIPPPRPFPTVYMKGGFVTTPEVHALVGEQVVWKNEDLVAHEIVDDAGFFTAQVIEAGDWWGHTFSYPNVYGFHCRVHPDVKGYVVVS